tara:strand:- start:87404 stop:87538 length:135 start_codon:yes stop_codon:yes gene_type:complete
MIVIAIIGIIASVFVPAFEKATAAKAQESSIQSDESQIVSGSDL